MATFKFATAMGDLKSQFDYYKGDVALTSNSSTVARWTDPMTLNSFTIEGDGLTFEAGMLVGGTIEKITFEDVEGADYMVVRGEHDTKMIGESIELGTIWFQNTINDGNDRIIGNIHNDALTGGDGKDRIFGGQGDDSIMGSAGRDILTGGEGADTFLFEGKMTWGGPDGHDVIRDFDAHGGGQNQDQLAINGEITDMYRDGKHTIIEVDNDLTLTLLHIKPSEITNADFLG